MKHHLLITKDIFVFKKSTIDSITNFGSNKSVCVICILDYHFTLSDQIKAYWKKSSLGWLTLLPNIIMQQVGFLDFLNIIK
jgi:hypothetical protein